MPLVAHRVRALPLLLLLLLTLVSLVSLVTGCSEDRAPTPGFAPPAENAICTECHNVPNLWVKDPITKERTLVTIDPQVYARSDHGGTRCVQCHETGYEGKLPHRGPNVYPRFLCVDCHEELGDVEQLRLEQRRTDLLAGAHGDTADQAFDCHDCHDPHVFRLVRAEERSLDRIHRSNKLCLPCHEDTAASHQRFPDPEAHFRKVKCLGCHVPKDSRTGHDLISAETSVRDCDSCHSAGASLAVTSYTILGARVDDRSQTEALENVYIVGASSSELLDLLSLAGFGIILLLVSAHGTARIVVARRRRRKAK